MDHQWGLLVSRILIDGPHCIYSTRKKEYKETYLLNRKVSRIIVEECPEVRNPELWVVECPRISFANRRVSRVIVRRVSRVMAWGTESRVSGMKVWVRTVSRKTGVLFKMTNLLGNLDLFMMRDFYIFMFTKVIYLGVLTTKLF